MEYQSQYFCSLFMPIILFAFIVIVKALKNPKSSHSKGKPPPGPWKLPIIGNMHHLVGDMPAQRLRDLAKKHGDVMSLQLGQLRTVVITSREAAKQVLKTHDLIFADRPLVLAAHTLVYNSNDIAFARYGDYWRQMRKICVVELLSKKRVESFGSDRKAEVSCFISRVNDSIRSPINLSRMFISLTNCITSRTAFGMLRDQEDAFLPVILKIAQALGGFTLSDLFPSIELLHVITGAKSRFEKLHNEVDTLLGKVINEHRAKRATKMKNINDGAEVDHARTLLDVLLDLQEDGDLEFPLTTENIKAIVLDIFLAGSETVATAMEWTMSEILKNPEVMKKAQAEVRQVYGNSKNIDESKLHELEYLSSVIKETLRLHPPAPLLAPRQNQEDVEIRGYYIPAPTQIIINAWALGRDPKYWEEPEKFQPERFLDSSIDYKGNDFEYIPFGSGRRICPGISYGIAVFQLTMANLLYHFDWMLPGGRDPTDLDMTGVFGITIKRKEELCIIPIPYTPSSST